MARTATKNMVFISHSSRDGEVANVLHTRLLHEDDLCPGISVRFTSANQTDSPALLDPATAIWKQLRKDMEETKCFIACLSEDFFKSAWCIAELTIFQELSRNKKPKDPDRHLVLLIVDSSASSSNYESFLVQDLLIYSLWRKTHVNRLACKLKEWRVRAQALTIPKLEQLRSEARKKLRSRAQAKKGNIAEIAEQHLSFPASTNGPITCLVRRDEYEQISVNMARRAENELLWTLFKSPLLVADAYRQRDLLMPYDKLFQNFDPIHKIRLVIFEDDTMARAYARCLVAYHKKRLDDIGATDIVVTRELLAQRKRKFEKSAKGHDGELYFTTLDRLLTIFPVSARLTFNKNSYLEFAYADSEAVSGQRLILESGFTSEFSRRHAMGRRHDKTVLQFRHVTFYVEPGKDCSESIQSMKAYKSFYGHIDALRVIATTLFSTLDPDPKVFVKSDKIQDLYPRT